MKYSQAVLVAFVSGTALASAAPMFEHHAATSAAASPAAPAAGTLIGSVGADHRNGRHTANEHTRRGQVTDYDDTSDTYPPSEAKGKPLGLKGDPPNTGPLVVKPAGTRPAAHHLPPKKSAPASPARSATVSPRNFEEDLRARDFGDVELFSSRSVGGDHRNGRPTANEHTRRGQSESKKIDTKAEAPIDSDDEEPYSPSAAAREAKLKSLGWKPETNALDTKQGTVALPAGLRRRPAARKKSAPASPAPSATVSPRNFEEDLRARDFGDVELFSSRSVGGDHRNGRPTANEHTRRGQSQSNKLNSQSKAAREAKSKPPGWKADPKAIWDTKQGTVSLPEGGDTFWDDSDPFGGRPAGLPLPAHHLSPKKSAPASPARGATVSPRNFEEDLRARDFDDVELFSSRALADVRARGNNHDSASTPAEIIPTVRDFIEDLDARNWDFEIDELD